MGVAVIISRWGSIRTDPHAPPLRGSLPPGGAASPWGGPAATRCCSLLRRARRWATPKRCCSSMMASAKFLKCTLSWMMACVPTTSCAWPLSMSSSMVRRSLAFCVPVSHAVVMPKGSNQPSSLRKCCSANISVGAISAHCQPASIQMVAASAATTVLPAPTSPCSKRCMGTLRAMSDAISAHTRCWALVRVKGSAASKRACSVPPSTSANTGARKVARARRDMSCESCCASSSSALSRCHAGWLWSCNASKDASAVGWCKKCNASRNVQSALGMNWLRSPGAKVSDSSARAKPPSTALRNTGWVRPATVG